MPDTEHERPIFEAKVEVPYDKRFIPSALDWAADIIQIAGGDSQEENAMNVALEETLFSS